MAVRSKKPLIPPDPSTWERYSPHYEAPLAGATSLFLHGAVIGIFVIGGLAFFVSAREEAARPPKMDVVMIEDGGGGLEGLSGEAGAPGAPGGGVGRPKRTEQVGSLQNAPLQPDRNTPRLLKDEQIELPAGLVIEGVAPLDPQLTIELAKLSKDATEHASKDAVPPGVGSDPKKSGVGGTRNPKGKGGLGGPGDGPGVGKKSGPGTGKGFGGVLTKQQKFARRWNFNVGSTSKEHVDILIALGVKLALQDPKGQIVFVTDLKRRPAEWMPGKLPDLAKTVAWGNGKPDSLQGLAHELQLPFVPKLALMLLPSDREDSMARAEELAANSMRRSLPMVRKTWFEFRLRNGTYEPVVSRFE